ncbi:MAG: hypothetical protein OEZ39_12795 [Gammaproteobacteria bacterium]|nr:hypothetical protein [Gammaproteobacteria bacterium]MDH5652725.1 hypothetical protein [Gammaproteobacteria bacterium]
MSKFLLCLTCFIFSNSLLAANTPNSTCNKWLGEAIKKQQSVITNKRYIKSLHLLSTSCKAIPDPLRTAAGKAGQAGSKSERRNYLMQSLNAFFPSECLSVKPGQPAARLPAVCLGEEQHDGPSAAILPNIDAAAYLYGQAVKMSFSRTNMDQDLARRFMQNYFLGAGLLYEAEEKN